MPATARVGPEVGVELPICKSTNSTSRPTNGVGTVDPGHGGCTIYSARPAACAGFSCAWLQGDLPEHWFPEEVRMFVDMRDTGAGRVLCVYVDPHFPDRWREDPYCADIENIAAGGLDGALGFRFATHVIVGGRVISAVGSPL